MVVTNAEFFKEYKILMASPYQTSEHFLELNASTHYCHFIAVDHGFYSWCPPSLRHFILIKKAAASRSMSITLQNEKTLWLKEGLSGIAKQGKLRNAIKESRFKKEKKRSLIDDIIGADCI
ncbi:hypothetical protein LOAG_06029 [Loa loa]|uniref:Uncharacterized protein n=1 Tax=Loa loa TaxID=7209 RepID=A0A1S0TYS2_LOALO|nr:hypothetical protein LOAG_06029 [Loa loa]EFO22459.1 hypothetical protein LOAG_06029 [Loa loa]